MADIGAVRNKANANMAEIQNNATAIGSISDKVEENAEGVAMSLAMAGTFLPRPGETVRLSGNWGNFEGSNAVAFSGAVAVSDKMFFTAGLGAGLEEDTMGGRAELSMGW